jgi:hypothetical protein
MSRRLLPLLLGLCLPGCFLVRDTINDSPAIRWWLFSQFGAPKVCPEMLSRGAPLKLGGDDVVVGRFFPTQCTAQAHDASQTLLLSFSGTGYAWTPVAGRVGYQCSVSVVYRPDFRMTEDALYVWSRMERIMTGPEFVVLSVEQPLARWTAQGPAGYLATTFGEQIISSKLSEGFTVVRTESGDDFSLGILLPPQRPRHPFRTNEQNFVAVNETIAVRVGQVDFLGPITVPDEDQHLEIRWQASGPTGEALLLPRFTADEWRWQLERGAALGPPRGAPSMTWLLPPGAGQLRVPLHPAQYVLVVDNSAQVGTQSPPWNLLSSVGQGALKMSVVVEIAED